MPDEKPCHICGNETDIICDSCDEPTCEDCCVTMTIHNQIDYPLCTECHESADCARCEEDHRQWQLEKKLKAKKEAIAATRRTNYWKPENIEKRRLAKIKRQKEREEADRERAAKVAEVMRDFMRFF